MDSGGYMVKLFTVAEMQALENEANRKGLSYVEMMENAGFGIANEIDIAYSHIPNKNIFALVGSGNNGGDALVALSYLTKNQWNTCAYIVRKRVANDPLIDRLIKLNGNIISIDHDNDLLELNKLIDKCSIVIDGIFGTGIKLPLSGETANVLDFIKNRLSNTTNRIHVVAVDCPSGIDCDTGAVAPETIPADMTVTMAGVKIGLINFPAANITGELRVASIGSIDQLDAYTKNKKIILSRELIKKIIPIRRVDSHKGTFGTTFIIAGSVSYTGAAFLAGMAAYRSGVGLVTMAVPEPLHAALSGEFPEATWVLLPHEMGKISSDAVPIIYKNINRATAVLIGPGFGLENTTREFLKGLLHQGELFHREKALKNTDDTAPAHTIPVVIDADGLKLLTTIDHWPELLASPAILTPHPGEMAVLTGLTIDKIQENRICIAKKYASLWGHVVVLKGAYTVIADPNEQIALVPVASPALAKAGTGDVLAGLIVGLRAQGVNAFDAACAGAWIHANAGLLAAQSIGNTASVIASDILNQVQRVISNLSNNTIPK
jgi:ADP-dependent NAD(P)H-hydrate dehydratase / NAD(P)H-hydrate epimerase